MTGCKRGSSEFSDVDNSTLVFSSCRHAVITTSSARHQTSMMHRASVVICILLVFNKTESDCGCNKFQRDKTESLLPKNEQCTAATAIVNNNERSSIEDMSLIPGGFYTIGTSDPVFPSDRESPENLVDVRSFYFDKYEVSNARFQEFIHQTNYETEAEKFNDSFIFQGLLAEATKKEYRDFRVVAAEWWYKVNGVNWKHPHGPESNLEALWNHPVVHVSWNDAVKYCSWRKKRLPTEAEWEVACRGGKKRKLFPWGNKMLPKDEHWMNIWQGDFPDNNTKDDGYDVTCPVNRFKQNFYDLYNVVGNVWEWTADLWSNENKQSKNPNRVKKGGSYLCHESYCYRYRCAARSQNTQDSSAGNLGFRCAKNLDAI